MSRLLHALKSLDSWAHEDPADLAPLVATRKGEPTASAPSANPPEPTNPAIGPLPPGAPSRAMPSVSETSDALPPVICSLTADRPSECKPAVAETMMFTPSSEPAAIASPFAGYRLSPEVASPVKPLVARAEPVTRPAERPATDPSLMTIAYEPPAVLASTLVLSTENVSPKPLPTFEEITAATPIEMVTPPPALSAEVISRPAEAVLPPASAALPIITEPLAAPAAPSGPEVSPLERFANHQLNQEATAARFANLAARLRQDVPWSTGRTLLFTGVGKTTDATELLLLLGITLAEANETVLVVDANRASARLTRELSANDLQPPSRGKKCLRLLLKHGWKKCVNEPRQDCIFYRWHEPKLILRMSSWLRFTGGN